MQGRTNPRTAIPQHLLVAAAGRPSHATDGGQEEEPQISLPALAASIKVGDPVSIRASTRPFREVASATNSWTNHVGIVTDTSGVEPSIGESTFPLSRTVTLTQFFARSEHGRIALARLESDLSADQQQSIATAVERRAGIFYDTGFNTHSRRQFCSRYVREVIHEATGIEVGEVETFST